MSLLVIHYDRECAPQPFLPERIRDRGLVPNVQLFHRAPPSLHCAGSARERRNHLTSAYSAATSSPVSEPPGQSFCGLRAWIEQGFKLTKRAGWQWQRTRMTEPHRAARLWLAVAVATLWLLSVGGEAEDTIPVGTLPALPANLLPPHHQRQATRLRLVSIFRRGWQCILVALLHHRPLPTGRLVPEPWPDIKTSGIKLRVMHGVPLAA